MVEIYKTASRVAPTDATVLIEGETGTGKELVARMIHRNSPRAQPAVRAGGLRVHRSHAARKRAVRRACKGAFTGADRDRIGVFEAAQSRHGFSGRNRRDRAEFPVASCCVSCRSARCARWARRARKKVDVRVVAATNRDLQKMVDEGKFREDLWFRLNVVRIVMPPLRERRGDVPLLARFLRQQVQRSATTATCSLTESGIKALQEYTWPGNVRQIAAPDRAADDSGAERPHRSGGGERRAGRNGIARIHAVETLADAEREQIRRVLAATGGNKSRAAQILGIERKTLYRKLERMKL